MNRTTRWVLAGTLVWLLALAGCSGIPTNSPVTDVTKVAAAGDGEAVAPSAGQPPDDIVRGFLTASGPGAADTTGLGAFSSARQYLSKDAQRTWPAPTYQVVILANDDRVIWNQQKQQEATITGTIFGTLDGAGVFHEGAGKTYSYTVRLSKVAGEWRIIDPPAQVVIRYQDFQQSYRQSSVYFLDQATGTVVVPDPRYISVAADKRPAKLMDLLLAGPGGVLAGAVRTELGGGAALRSNVVRDTSGNITVDLTGVNVPTAARRALAAQIVWTLSKDADQVAIKVGGLPLDNVDYYTLANFQTFDPDRTPGTGAVHSDPYYIASASSAQRSVIRSLVDDSRMPGSFGDGSLDVESAAMSAPTGMVAAVTDTAGDSATRKQLVIGNPFEQTSLKTALKASGLTAPSFSRSGDEVWVVQNGTSTKPEVYQISASSAGAELPSRAKIGSAVLTGKGPVTALRISPDGVRVAIVAGGRLYLGAVSLPDPSGDTTAQPGTEVKMANIIRLTPLGTGLTDVGAVVFNTSTELLVAAKSAGSNLRAVTRVAIDGSYVKGVSSLDITSDVDAVAVSSSGPATLYAAFNSRIYRLNGALDGGHWITPPIPGNLGLLYGSNPFFPE